MIRFALRALHYLGAFLNGQLDAVMDPRVQIDEAIAEAKRQHGLLSEQAGAVIGHQRELEIKIARSEEHVAHLRRNAEQSLILGDQARKAGDTATAGQRERTARVFASQLATEETSLANLRELHATAVRRSETAKRAVEHNRFVLERQLQERTRLLGQLEAAKLAERMAKALDQVTGTSMQTSPTLPDVRDRIDARFSRATGRGEIAASSIDALMLDTEHAVIDREGEERLAEIRREIGLDG